jgi:hypothetical protein
MTALSNINGIKFNASKEVLNAMQMIREGKTLTFKEEYSIEAVWHEFLHGKSAGLSDARLTATQRVAMEVVNQFVARKSYPQFLSELGGVARHKDKILSNGFGYGKEVGNLNRLLNKYRINDNDFFDYFENKILSEKYTNIENVLVEWLTKKGVKQAQKCVKNLTYIEDDFESFLDKFVLDE